MNTEWIKTRQTRYTAYLVTYLVVIVAVLAAANWVANRYDKSYDATSNKRFSLSDQTIKVVKNLKQDVDVTYFDESRNFTSARDLLERYHSLSPGKFHVKYVDPTRKPQVARAAGIRDMGTTVIAAGAKKEQAKSVTEEEITSALIRSLKTGERNACFVTGSGEARIDDSDRSGFSSVKDSLERNNYKTRTINLLQGAATPASGKVQVAPDLSKPQTPVETAKAEVPKDCTVLIVAGPRYDYPPAAVAAIKTYVENGGRLLVMLDPPLQTGKEPIAPNTALDQMLAGWGVTANPNLVLDVSGMGRLLQLGPEVPLVVNYESSPIVRELKEVPTAFPLSRALEVKSADKTSAEKLLSTGDNSYAVEKLSGEITLDTNKDKKGPFALAASGTFTGADKDHQGRFVVTGSSRWASNSYIRFGGNRDLFLNMMNWLSSDEDLISIRPKEPEDRRLNLSARQVNTLFYSSVVFLPLIVIASGFAVWWRRR